MQTGKANIYKKGRLIETGPSEPLSDAKARALYYAKDIAQDIADEFNTSVKIIQKSVTDYKIDNYRIRVIKTGNY